MEALEGASSLQFYQLKALIEGMRPTRGGALPLVRISIWPSLWSSSTSATARCAAARSSP